MLLIIDLWLWFIWLMTIYTRVVLETIELNYNLKIQTNESQREIILTQGGIHIVSPLCGTHLYTSMQSDLSSHLILNEIKYSSKKYPTLSPHCSWEEWSSVLYCGAEEGQVIG